MERNNGRRNPALVTLSRRALKDDALVAYITSLPDEKAPDSEKLAYMSGLLLVMARVQQDSLAALRNISLVAPPPGVMANSILTPWVAGDPVTIFDQAILTAGTFNCDHLVDFRDGKRLSLKAESSLDVNVNIQMIGNMDDSLSTADAISTPKSCAAGGSRTIGLAWDDWQDYIGCQILVPVAPTTGRLKIRVTIQS